MANNNAKKPRGKPFEKGNTNGFKKGQSGNPAGRPRGVRYISEALRIWLVALNGIDDKTTNADQIAACLGTAALSGDVKAIQLILDRVEGPLKEVQYGFVEPPERQEEEQEIYRVMDTQQLDRDEAVDLMNERQEEEERERKMIYKEVERLNKAEEKRIAKEEKAAAAKAEADRAASIAANLERLKLVAEDLRKPKIPASEVANFGHGKKEPDPPVRHMIDDHYYPVNDPQPKPEPRPELTPQQEIELWKEHRRRNG